MKIWLQIVFLGRLKFKSSPKLVKKPSAYPGLLIRFLLYLYLINTCYQELTFFEAWQDSFLYFEVPIGNLG